MNYFTNLPDEVINKIYGCYFQKYILQSQEFKNQIFKFKLNKMSFKQKRDLLLYNSVDYN